MSLHALSLSQRRLPTECNNKLHLLIITISNMQSRKGPSIRTRLRSSSCSLGRAKPNQQRAWRIGEKRGGDLVMKEAHAETLELLW